MKSPSSINCITKFKRNIRSDIPLTISLESQSHTLDLEAPRVEIQITTNLLEFNPIYGKARFYIYGAHAQEVKFNCDFYPYRITANNIDSEEHELDVKLYFENGYSTVWSNKLLLEIY